MERVPPIVWRRLAAYDWPGNVRELRNLVEPCVLLADGPEFPGRWLHLGETSAGAETSAGVQSDGDNVSLTARVLGTTREKLRYRVQKYGLKTSD